MTALRHPPAVPSSLENKNAVIDGVKQSSYRWRCVAVLLIAGLLCLVNLGGYRPLTSHEVLVAQTAREMLDANEWVLPTFCGEPRLKKPPLAYWLANMSYRLAGGCNDWTARLPFALGGVLLVSVAMSLARRMYGNKAAVAVGFVQATTVYFLIQARLAEADVWLALFVAVAMGAFADASGIAPDRRNVVSRHSRWWFWLALGGSILAKGPIGPALIAAAMLPYALIAGRLRQFAPLFKAGPIAIFGAMVLAWPVTVASAHPEAVNIWLSESLGRFQRDPNGVTRYFGYYPVAALWLTLPWTPWWILRLWRTRTRWLADNREMLLVCWLVGPIVLLSLSGGKQEHYLIPALLPCCLWTGRLLTLQLRRLSNRRRRTAYGLALAGVAVAVVFQCALEPRLHGRREAARWMQQQSASIEQPVIALGHSVRWLAFYAQTPLVRIDSIEELQQRFRRSVEVVTIDSIARRLQTIRPVTYLSVCPPDKAGAKSPVRILLGPTR